MCNLLQKVIFNQIELFILENVLFLSLFVTCYRIFYIEPALERYNVPRLYITIYCNSFQLAKFLGNDKNMMISFESFTKKREVDLF